MRIEVDWFAPDWGGGPLPERWPMRIQNFDRILDEDLQFAAAIQESVMSPGFRGMPLNYQERRIYHWHQELDRRIGAETHRSGAARRAAPRAVLRELMAQSRGRPR